MGFCRDNKEKKTGGKRLKAIEGRRILIGVSGGIAAYKSAFILREIRKIGAQTKVVMTPFSTEFVGRLTLETLSGNKVFVDWTEDPLAHINLARWADVFLIAPCTVNTLSKIALGIGDNLLTSTVLAYKGPLVIAPAANTTMYRNPAVRENIRRLKERGIVIVEPEWGVLACEEEGEGKLASEKRIVDWLLWTLYPKPLKDKKVLLTCGATREYMDPVRFISNESSGEMGFSLARVARWLGADVKVIAGFTTAQEPPEVEIVRVKTGEEMLKEALGSFMDADIVIMNAAVADYRPKERSCRKIKKRDELTVELERVPDILEELGNRKKHQFLVGFALESEDLIENARDKLGRKNLDMIVANPVEVMGAMHHKGYVITEDLTEDFEFSSKIESAHYIMEKILELYLKKWKKG